jgi:hypothetical protein
MIVGVSNATPIFFAEFTQKRAENAKNRPPEAEKRVNPTRRRGTKPEGRGIRAKTRRTPNLA